MERRELKFKRHHFNFNGDYIQSTEWGIFDYGFKSPSSLSAEDKCKVKHVIRSTQKGENDQYLN